MSLRKLLAAAMIALGGCGDGKATEPTPQHKTSTTPTKPIYAPDSFARHEMFRKVSHEIRIYENYSVVEATRRNPTQEEAVRIGPQIDEGIANNPRVQKDIIESGISVRDYKFELEGITEIVLALYRPADQELETQIKNLLADFSEFIGRDANLDIVFPASAADVQYTEKPKIYLFGDYVVLTHPDNIIGTHPRTDLKITINPGTWVEHQIGVHTKLLENCIAGKSRILINLHLAYERQHMNIVSEAIHYLATPGTNARLLRIPEDERTLADQENAMFAEEGLVHAIETAWMMHYAYRHPEIPKEYATDSINWLMKIPKYAQLKEYYERIMPTQVRGEPIDEYLDRIKQNARWALEEFLQGN